MCLLPLTGQLAQQLLSSLEVAGLRKCSYSLESLAVAQDGFGHCHDLLERQDAAANRHQQREIFTLETHERISVAHQRARGQQQPDSVHHVLGIEIQLASFLLLPARLIALAAPSPVVVVVRERLLPAGLVVDQQTCEPRFSAMGRAGGVEAFSPGRHGITWQKSSRAGGTSGLGLLTHLFCPLAFLICDMA